MSFSLDTVEVANLHFKPQKVLIYGVPGLGKSTFGATFKNGIMLRTEDGAGALNIQTFPQMAEKFEDIEEAIKSLHGEKNTFNTLVIDSLDWLEPIIWKKQLEFEPTTEKGVKITDIEGYGYGRGFTKALTWWRYIMGGLDSLRLNKNMSIVLIAHAQIKRHDPPDSDPYDRYQTKLHKFATALWQEWSDMVLFCNYKTTARKNADSQKATVRRTGAGERIVFTEERPAFLAKNRWGLPSEIYVGQDETWGAFHEALSSSTNGRYEIPNQKTEKE